MILTTNFGQTSSIPFPYETSYNEFLTCPSLTYTQEHQIRVIPKFTNPIQKM